MYDYSTLTKQKNKKFKSRRFLIDNEDHMEEYGRIMTKAKFPNPKEKTSVSLISKARVDSDQMGTSYYILEWIEYENHKQSPFAASKQFNDEVI